MRVRVWVGAAAVLVAAGAVQAPAHAVPVVPPAVARPVRSVAAPRARTVTLVTGEQVRVSGPAGHERVVVVRQARAADDTLVVRRTNDHLYVFPVGIEHLLGRLVDPALFDLRGTHVRADGRMPVRLTYTGDRPDVPGLHVSSARDGKARGYVTTRSAATFGRALRAAAGGSSALAGVRSIGAASVAAPTGVHPRYPMKNLVIKVLDADGKPQAEGDVFVMNVDDGSRYGDFALVTDGVARVSVPTGRYTAYSDDFVEGATEDTGRLTIVTVDEYSVTGQGQTLTIDHRSATVRPAASTPLPADPTSLYVEWDRADAGESFFFSGSAFVRPGLDLAIAPSAPATVGTLTYEQDLVLAQRGATTPAYAYYLSSRDDHIPAQASRTWTTGQLASVTTTFDGDGSGHQGGFTRVALFGDDEGGGGGDLDPVALGTRRTDYVGATGDAVWFDELATNLDADEDPGFIDGEVRSLPAGTSSTQEWARGPLGAGVPTQSADGFCLTCRSGDTLSLGLAPVTDSDPTHVGDLLGSGDELSVARFRLYRGDRLVDDEDDTTGAYLDVRAKKAFYTAVVDVDRRASRPRLSTLSRTELGFSSARNKGARLPSGWVCDGPGCRVLPILQARASLPTDLQGTLPLGRQTVTVRAAQVQNAKTSAITSAGLEYRPAGGEWTEVDLRRTSEGSYTGVIDDTDDPGALVDVRISASDAAGSTYRQTVGAAFAVAAK